MEAPCFDSAGCPHGTESEKPDVIPRRFVSGCRSVALGDQEGRARADWVYPALHVSFCAFLRGNRTLGRCCYGHFLWGANCLIGSP